MKNLSVIVVSWNARDYLQGCLESLRETGADSVLEVIVVDNDSADGSPEMVEQQFPEVILIRAGSNLGFARANNLAMKVARGELFALVNSDVLVHPGCLASLAAFLAEHPAVGMVGPRVTGGDGQLQLTSRKLPTLWNTLCRTLALDRILPGSAWFSGFELPAASHRQGATEQLSGCFCVVRKQAVAEVGGMDERFFFYGEDMDWCKRFSDGGWQLMYVPEATATHFGGGSSANAPLRFSIEIHRANLQYWHKHHGLAGRYAYYWLAALHHGLRLAARAAREMLAPGDSPASRYKLEEDKTCLRWLLAGKEL